MTTETLEDLRRQLDELDAKIIELLDSRYIITDRVADYKNINGVALTDKGREVALIERLSGLAKHPALAELIPELYERIITANKNYRAFMKEANMPVSSIGIIGLGLIGGSIAKAVHAKLPSTTIHTFKRPGSDRGQVPYVREHATLEELAQECDCIFICTPIDDVIENARLIAGAHDGKKPLLVMDVASVKTDIASEFKNLTKGPLQFVPSHPMAGSDKSGFNAARSLLFVHMPWIVTPHPANDESSVQNAEAIIRFLGSTPIIATADEHDAQTAVASHLIFLLSTYAYAFVQDLHPDSLAYTGTGFISLTRLASANDRMHEQIVRNNRRNVTEAMNGFIEYIHDYAVNLGDSLPFFKKNKESRDKFVQSRET